MTQAEGLRRAREVFDNGDYTQRQEELKNPAHPTLRFLGRAALLFAGSQEGAEKVQRGFDNAVAWWKDKTSLAKEMYTQHKALVKEKGSLDVVSDQFTAHNEPIAPARPVLASPGVYRSNFSGEQPQPELGGDEMDEIMANATRQARIHLGALPVMTMHSEPAPMPTGQPRPAEESRGLEDPEVLPRRNRDKPEKTIRSDGPAQQFDPSLLDRLVGQPKEATETPEPAARLEAYIPPPEEMPIIDTPGVVKGEVVEPNKYVRSHRKRSYVPRHQGEAFRHRTRRNKASA